MMTEKLDTDTADAVRTQQQAALEASAGEPVEVYNEGRYQGFAEDLDFGWRWSIQRDGEEIQQGCAVSLDSATRSVGHVMVYFNGLDHQEGHA